MPRQSGQQPGLNQRRLAATARPVQQPDAEGLVRVGLLNAPLPEAEAVGQAVAVARAGQQLEKEIGVGGVIGAQPLWHDSRRSQGGRDVWRQGDRTVCRFVLLVSLSPCLLVS